VRKRERRLTDQFVRTALNERHATLAGPVIAHPRKGGTPTGGLTLEGSFHCRVEFREWRPRLVFVNIVHLREDDRRRRGNSSRPRDAEIGRLQKDDDDKDHEKEGKRDEEFSDHGCGHRFDTGSF